MRLKNLQIQQMDKKMELIKVLRNISISQNGWINGIRKALGISSTQLGKRINMTRQGIGEIEKREKEGTITINSLKKIALAMDMEFVYGFVPLDGSLAELIDRKALELAQKIVLRTSNTMRLENQENSIIRLEHAVLERKELIKKEMPKALWD